MSAASLRVLKGQIERGVANLDTIDTWQSKKLLTQAEADEARAYWHQLYDPPPAPDPTSEPEEPADDEDQQPVEEPPAGG